MTNLLYKPVGALLGFGASLVAGMLFKQVWRIARQNEAPNATDEERRWGEILAAAALQGASFAVVKAAVDRAGAQGMRRVTGAWPS